MPPTLAELTLELSRALSELEARYAEALAEAERERDGLILAGPGRRVLERYYQALEKARAKQLEAVEKAAATGERKANDAEQARRLGIQRAEKKYREAQRKSERARSEEARRARDRHQKAYQAAERAPLLERHRLKRAADEALEQALAKAREAYAVDVEGARLAYRASVQDELVEERIAIAAAGREAGTKARAAAVAYERTVADQEIQLRRELNEFPEAKQALDRYDEIIFRTRESCEAEKEALFAEFERRRRELSRSSRNTRKK